MSVRQLIVIALGLGFLYGMFTVGAPFLLAIVVAVLLEPITAFLMRSLKLKRIFAATLTCTVFLLLLIGGIYIVGAQVFVQFMNYWQYAPVYFQDVQAYIQSAFAQAQGLYQNFSPDVVSSIEQFLSGLSGQLGKVVNTLSQTFLSLAKGIPGLFVFFIVFLVAVYMFSFSMGTMRASILSLFEERSHKQVNEVMTSLKQSIFGFIRAQIILSLFTYITTLAGLLILRVEYPLAIALLVTIVDIMPILGVGSALVPWAVYCMLTGNWFVGIGLIVLFIVITVLRRVIEPKILGDAVGIGALSALISLYVGFKLVGVVGLFLGPLVVIIYQAMRKAGLLQIKIRF